MYICTSSRSTPPIKKLDIPAAMFRLRAPDLSNKSLPTPLQSLIFIEIDRANVAQNDSKHDEIGWTGDGVAAVKRIS